MSSSVHLPTRVVCWKVKVTSSLTDVWHQLFEQQDITVMHHSLSIIAVWKPHGTAEPGDTDWNQSARTCLLETSKRRRSAKAASDSNLVSNQQSFTDQATDQWHQARSQTFLRGGSNAPSHPPSLPLSFPPSLPFPSPFPPSLPHPFPSPFPDVSNAGDTSPPLPFPLPVPSPPLPSPRSRWP